MCTSVVHNTAWSSSDNIPRLPPDNHRCSDAVYRRRGWYQGSNVNQRIHALVSFFPDSLADYWERSLLVLNHLKGGPIRNELKYKYEI